MMARSFLPGIKKSPTPEMRSSITGKTAIQIWKLRSENGDKEEVTYVKFGPWIFLDEDYVVFQSALIKYVPDINRLCRWVADEKCLQDYEISYNGTDREMICDWCGRTVNKGVDDESWQGGDEAVQDIAFARFQILDCCFGPFMEELLKWREQAIIWAEEDVSKWQKEVASLIALAERGERAMTEIRIAQELLKNETEGCEMGGAFWAGAGPISEEAEKELALGIEEARQKRIREDELALSQATPEQVPLAGVVSRDGQSLVEEEVEFTTTSGDPESAIGFHDALEKKSSQPT